MAQIAKSPVPHKLYRHFAIITVALTVLLALLLNDESRQAVADEIEQRDRQAELQRISAEKTRPPQLARRDSSAHPRFNGGDTQAFGQPMQQIGASSRSKSILPETGATRKGEATVIPGYTRDYLDSLTDEQYRQLLNNVREAGLLSAEDREQSRANLADASRRRSGMSESVAGDTNDPL